MGAGALEEVERSALETGITGFEENRGQVTASGGSPAPYVKFRLRGEGSQIFLLNDGIAFQFERMHFPEGFTELELEAKWDRAKSVELDELQKQVRRETYRMDMRLEGANPDPLITTEGESNDYINYYTHDVLEVRSYERITYHDVYPGIDWVVYTNAEGFKYDFIAHPGADPSMIQMKYINHEELRIDANGDLIHGNRLGSFVEKKPVSFQEGREVDSRFVLEGNKLRFALGSYDNHQTLVIDPLRIWGTYYGSGTSNRGESTAVDGSGNVYLAGYTFSSRQ